MFSVVQSIRLLVLCLFCFQFRSVPFYRDPWPGCFHCELVLLGCVTLRYVVGTAPCVSVCLFVCLSVCMAV